MHCPFCGSEETKVTDSRFVTENNSVRRRRSCLHCEERFTTYETIELSMPRVVKRDETRIPFDEHKLRSGMLLALQKRPVSMDQIESSIAHLIKQIRSSGEKEVTTTQIGEWVMDELKKLDHVAYVRFASVYRRFKDLDEFKKEIEGLIK